MEWAKKRITPITSQLLQITGNQSEPIQFGPPVIQLIIYIIIGEAV